MQCHCCWRDFPKSRIIFDKGRAHAHGFSSPINGKMNFARVPWCMAGIMPAMRFDGGDFLGTVAFAKHGEQ